MLHAKIQKSLIAAQIGMWLPVLSLFLLPAGTPSFVPIALICAGWLITPVFTLWNLINALRALGTGTFDPWILRTAMWHKLAMLPATAINLLFCFGVPMAFLNPWLVWFLPVAAIPIALSMGCTWLATLSTSVFVIAQTVHLWRQKALTLLQGIGGVLLQLVPVVDTAHCLALRARHAPKSAPPGNQAQASPAPGAAASWPPPPR